MPTTEARSARFRGPLLAAALLFAATGCTQGPGEAEALASRSNPETKEWIQLFNGKDLKDWDIKFNKHPLNHNLHNTFRVEDGLLKVRYDNWTDFDREFGHIFYKDKFSHYVVAAEYRFVGEQVTGAGPENAWAIRNNGIMVHSQSAESMEVNQEFPNSIEVQLLGGLGSGERSTGNLCTPGTNVVMDGKLFTPHCTSSSSETYHGDQWVRAEVLVLGDSVIKHIINGDTVLSYTKPQLGSGSEPEDHQGELLREGYIALQAETAPIEFRKVELLDLKGCTDPEALNYKSYYLESSPDACQYPTD